MKLIKNKEGEECEITLNSIHNILSAVVGHLRLEGDTLVCTHHDTGLQNAVNVLFRTQSPESLEAAVKELDRYKRAVKAEVEELSWKLNKDKLDDEYNRMHDKVDEIWFAVAEHLKLKDGQLVCTHPDPSVKDAVNALFTEQTVDNLESAYNAVFILLIKQLFCEEGIKNKVEELSLKLIQDKRGEECDITLNKIHEIWFAVAEHLELKEGQLVCTHHDTGLSDAVNVLFRTQSPESLEASLEALYAYEIGQLEVPEESSFRLPLETPPAFELSGLVEGGTPRLPESPAQGELEPDRETKSFVCNIFCC